MGNSLSFKSTCRFFRHTPPPEGIGNRRALLQSLFARKSRVTDNAGRHAWRLKSVAQDEDPHGG